MVLLIGGQQMVTPKISLAVIPILALHLVVRHLNLEKQGKLSTLMEAMPM